MWYRTVGCLVTLALRLLTAPLAAEAQPGEPVRQIGLLGLGCTDAPRDQYHREVFLQAELTQLFSLAPVLAMRPESL